MFIILSNKKNSLAPAHNSPILTDVNATEEMLVYQHIQMKSDHLLDNFPPNPLPKFFEEKNGIFFLHNFPAEGCHCQKHRLITVGALWLAGWLWLVSIDLG